MNEKRKETIGKSTRTIGRICDKIDYSIENTKIPTEMHSKVITLNLQDIIHEASLLIQKLKQTNEGIE